MKVRDLPSSDVEEIQWLPPALRSTRSRTASTASASASASQSLKMPVATKKDDRPNFLVILADGKYLDVDMGQELLSFAMPCFYLLIECQTWGIVISDASVVKSAPPTWTLWRAMARGLPTVRACALVTKACLFDQK